MRESETLGLFSSALTEFLDAREDLRRERNKTPSSTRQILDAEETLAEAAQALDDFFEK